METAGSTSLGTGRPPRAYLDRHDAGAALAELLARYAGQPDVLVLGLPRGGVPVAYEVARALRAPLDVFVVRKLGLPGHEELAMGAVASGGIVVLNRPMIESLGVSDAAVCRVLDAEKRELARREERYRDDLPPPRLTDTTVILVDDGLATGSSMFAALQALKQEHPKRVVVAVPVGAPDTCETLRSHADEVVCARTPEPFYGVGAWYEDFSQTTDAEVHELLERAGGTHGAADSAASHTGPA
jgi:predicted phosphoribosyltransferase